LSQNPEITKLTEIVNFTSIYGIVPVLEIIAVAPHYCIPDSRGPRNLFGTAGDLGQQVQKNLGLTGVHVRQQGIWVIEVRGSGV